MLLRPCPTSAVESTQLTAASVVTVSRSVNVDAVIAKFHYTDTNTDPNGPNGVSPQKKSVSVSV